MAFVDANYEFLYVDIGCNAIISDGGMFCNCSLSKAIEHNDLNIPPPRLELYVKKYSHYPKLLLQMTHSFKRKHYKALPTSQFTS